MYGQFNPYGGAYPAMQNRLASMEQQYQQINPIMPMQQQGTLAGKTVTSIEEAKASPIAVDGTMTYFPCPSQDKLFVRYVNERGMSVFKEYVPKADAPQVKYAEENIVAGLVKRIERIERGLGYDESNANNANAE